MSARRPIRRLLARVWTPPLLALSVWGCGGSPSAPGAVPDAAGRLVVPSGSAFGLTSPAFVDGGHLPAQYTCKSQTGLAVETNPPLAWANPPAGTVGYVLLASTQANEGSARVTKYNWVLYDIPAGVSSIPENNTVITSGTSGTTLVGSPGLTSDGPFLAYSPPCSPRGSGLRTYTFTLYALSARPVFAFNRVPGAGGDGANVAAALTGITLARSAVNASYTF